jgi:hypothetical protein
MGKRRGAAVWLMLGLAVGCGGSQKKPSAPAEESAVVAESGAAAPLTPTAASADLIGVLRLKNPGAFLDRLGRWSKAPVDWRRELIKERPGIERVIKFDAAIEAALQLDSKRGRTLNPPLAAVSLGLSSLPLALEFARSNGEVVRQLSADVYGLGDPPRHCAIARALGDAPARLVCGAESDDLEGLLPYMTRGMPREAFGNSDLHIELRGDPVRVRHGRDLRQLQSLVPFALNHLAMDVPRFDRALGDALHAVANEAIAFVEDFQRLDVDFSLLEGPDRAELKASAHFRGQNSWLVQTGLERRTAEVPDVFWALPKDAASASFAYPASVKRYEGMRRTFAELADSLLEHEKVPRPVRDQVADVINETWKSEAAWGGTDGVLPDLPASPGASRGASKRDRVRSQVGWHIAVVAEKSERFIKDFTRLLRLYNSQPLRQLFTKHVKRDLDLPRIQQRAPRGRNLPGAVAFEVLVPGALLEDVEPIVPIDVPGRPKQPKKAARPKPKPLPVVLVIMPDGERTWFGLSTDEKFVVDKLATLKTANANDTLAGREGLAELKAVQAAGGGFLTVASLAARLDEFAPETGRSMGRILNALPHHGEVPMPFSFTATRAAQPVFTGLARVPRAAFEDLGALIPAAVAVAPSREPAPTPAQPRHE